MNQGSSPANPWNPELYDGKHSFVWEAAASLVELLNPQPGERILDLGCGTGQLTAKIQSLGANVVGLDNSPEMIEEARRLFPEIQFDLADAHQFQYADRFDAVFSNAALHWIQHPDQVIQSIAKALKSGGRFVAEFGGRGNVRKVAESLEVASQEIVGQAISHPWYFPSIGEFATLLEKHGLVVRQAALFPRPTPLEGEDGLRNWVRMFGRRWLDRIPESRQDEFFQRVENHARPWLFREGQWQADYSRLRTVAILA